MRLCALLFAVAITAACSSNPASNVKPGNNVNNNTARQTSGVPVYGYEIVNTYLHDPKAFTEGLFYYDGFLYESTGNVNGGYSSMRKVDLMTGKVVQEWKNPGKEFGEGIAMIGDKIYQLTYQDGLARSFDAKTFAVQKEFSYQGEGWGMTTDGTNLIFDQGTHVLKIVDPATFQTVRTLPVMQPNGHPLMQINELEIVKGELWANIWHSEQPEILGKPNYIARIDLSTGKVIGWIDLANISPDDQPKPGEKLDPADPNSKEENTMNGIAYDAEKDRIFVTGKDWKHLYEIRVTGPKNQ
ncbi:MAG TPA: glutaminyl-peptide cyclotransferase [Pyrinomonadaceae bacterium]|jgi:glutaminyl-peptide cyclotransferase